MKLSLSILSALLLTGCQQPAPVPPDPPYYDVSDVYVPPPEPPPAVVDAGPAPVLDAAPPMKDAAAPPGDIFDTACQNLAKLRCKEAFSAAPQDSCANVLRHAQKIANMKPECVAAASSVAAAKKCGRYCAHFQP